MGFDFFTIHHLAAELDESLRGRNLIRAGSNESELGLEVVGGGYLYAVLAREGWLCWLPGLPPDRLRTQSGAEPYLVGATVEKVWADSRERMIWLRLSRPDSAGHPSYGLLVFELIHPHFQAYLASELSGLVLRRWGEVRKLRLKKGQPYVAPANSGRLLPGSDRVEEFVASCAVGKVTKRSLAQRLVGMDDLIVGQLLDRCGLTVGDQFTERELQGFWRLAEDLYGQQPDTRGFVWEGEGGVHFSGLAPADQPMEVWPSISQAIHRVKSITEPQHRADPDEATQRLQRAQSLLHRRLKALKGDLLEAEAAERCERDAAVLLANLGSIPRGAKMVELADTFDGSGQLRVRIELDPQCPAVDTAAHLSRMAKRYRRRRQLLPERIAEIQRLLTGIDLLLENPKTTKEEAEGWLQRQGMDKSQKNNTRHEEPRVHPRRYRTSTGWSVWAGRNNVENDLLSHRLAAQNDYWFHAHGYPGSHVVLRREGRKEEPSAQTLREAAGVAAYWSKGKTAKKVPVAYTLVKYVSKPRGGAPGQALMKREKSLMVEPRLLPEEDQQQE